LTFLIHLDVQVYAQKDKLQNLYQLTALKILS